jgi:hypothetical protein
MRVTGEAELVDGYDRTVVALSCSDQLTSLRREVERYRRCAWMSHRRGAVGQDDGAASVAVAEHRFAPAAPRAGVEVNREVTRAQ